MASFEQAAQQVLHAEGALVNHPSDRGGLTKYGICQRDFPAEDIRSLSSVRACELYREHYWPPEFDQLQSQKLANKLLDLCVWMGVPTAIRLVQAALHAADDTVAVDGKMGPQTLMAMNLTDEWTLVRELRVRAAERVFAIVQRDPTQRTFLVGWLRRAIR